MSQFEWFNYDNIINNLKVKYSPFVQIIEVKVNTIGIKKDLLLCDEIHKKYEGNKLQAQIIYEKFIQKSNFFK